MSKKQGPKLTSKMSKKQGLKNTFFGGRKKGGRVVREPERKKIKIKNKINKIKKQWFLEKKIVISMTTSADFAHSNPPRSSTVFSLDFGPCFYLQNGVKLVPKSGSGKKTRKTHFFWKYAGRFQEKRGPKNGVLGIVQNDHLEQKTGLLALPWVYRFSWKRVFWCCF